MNATLITAVALLALGMMAFKDLAAVKDSGFLRRLNAYLNIPATIIVALLLLVFLKVVIDNL